MTTSLLPIPTQRLRFRPYRPSDTELVLDLFSDRYAARFYPSMASADAALGWIEWNLDNYERHGFGLWVVESIETDRAVGDCGLTVQEVAGEPMTEVGYHIIDCARRQGYATEAARACLAFALDDLNLASVCSIVEPRNEASIRVAARIHATRSEFLNRQGETMLLFATRNED